MKRSTIQRKSSLIRCKSTLRRSRSTGKPTKAEAERMGQLKVMGCIACRINRDRGFYDVCFGWPYSDVHHLLSGGRRRGHLFSLPLCAWHHRSIPPVQGLSTDGAVAVYGPSLERQKAFRDYYGTDDELLAMVNKILEENP